MKDTFDGLNGRSLNCSKIIIPCHIDEGMGHWVLVIREKEENTINVYYIDSLTRSEGRQKKVFNVLHGTPLAPLCDHCSWINLPNPCQQEVECGARVCLHIQLCSTKRMKLSPLQTLLDLPDDYPLQKMSANGLKNASRQK